MEPDSHDAYPPSEIAHRVERAGVAKAHTDTITLSALAILAGAFISLGALFFTVTITGATPGFGLARLAGGLAFCLGLVLVVVAGAELFTGNNLIAMAWASRLVGTREVVRNWVLAYAGNVAGCLATVALVIGCNTAALGGGAVGETAIAIAKAKAELPAAEGFFRGVLCNALVCLAVWLTIGARSVTDKILAIVFPIAAFVTVGFEHSIANWFFLPYGLALAPPGTIPLAGVATNLAAVTAGNIVGGTVLVASVYWVAYLRGERVRGEATRR
ncbi:MAG: formate/nitrite transporter family protein [Burkholderiales bacterium]|nr:formate/nitrite transporter family protein [Burkholderiales bacterium]